MAFVVTSCVISLLAGLLHLLWFRWKCMMDQRMHGPSACKRSKDEPLATMVVLGTGGHTTEMTLLLQHFSRSQYRPLAYVYTAEFDRQTVEKIEASRDNMDNCRFLWIPRSRRVGQSWITSVFTTLGAVPRSVLHVIEHKPALLLCNGPGVCIPVCIGAVLLNLIWNHRCAIVFIESICRVQKLSFSGKILKFMATVFFVQWPVPGAPSSAICLANSSKQDDAGTISETSPAAGGAPSSQHCLVTVGTTNFDSLIRVLDASAQEFATSLKGMGITSCTIQVGGTSTFWPDALEQLPEFTVVKKLAHAEFLKEVDRAALIIGHAGAGTILEALSRGKQLLIVPNRTLMDDHQLELCAALEGMHCVSCSEDEVVSTLSSARQRFEDVDCSLPPHLTTDTFASFVDRMLRC